MNKFEICNLALANLGSTRPIQSFAENSTEARLCNSVYDIAKEAVLKAFPWRFAKYSAALTVTTDTSKKYSYVYEYPDDCIRVLSVSDQDGVGINEDKFEVFVLSVDSIPTKRVLTDTEDAYAQYILNVDEDMFSAEFIEALSWKISALVGMGLAKTTQAVQFAQQMYEVCLSKAEKAEMLESDRNIEQKPKYMRVRRAANPFGKF